jgi:hypothetical protein
MTYQTTYGLRQIVRPIGRHERIPLLSTADLLRQEVRPFALYEPDPEVEVDFKKRAIKEGANASARLKHQQCHARFAPHIQTIKRMRQSGATFNEIGDAIGMKRQTVNGHYWRNRELFK